MDGLILADATIGAINLSGSKRCLVRGTTLYVTASFTDQYGQPAEPSSVSITFTYFAAATGLPTSQTYTMGFSPMLGSFSYDWDSTPAGPGIVTWYVNTPETPQPSWANQGCFTLIANSSAQEA